MAFSMVLSQIHLYTAVMVCSSIQVSSSVATTTYICFLNSQGRRLVLAQVCVITWKHFEEASFCEGL